MDSESRRLLDLETLRERLRVGYNGLAIISGVYSPGQQSWLRSPAILLQGIALEEETIVPIFTRRIEQLASHLGEEFALDEDLLNEEARVTLRRGLFELLGKKPVVISLIQSV